jgi:hypothetical protein
VSFVQNLARLCEPTVRWGERNEKAQLFQIKDP